jgi:hypothetical protein
MGDIKFDDFTEEEQALIKGSPYVMKPVRVNVSVQRQSCATAAH